MTCAEFQRRNTNNTTFAAQSRGERAQCVAHFFSCASCREWVENCLQREPREDRLVNRADLEATIDRDMEDPEFHRVVSSAWRAIGGNK